MVEFFKLFKFLKIKCTKDSSKLIDELFAFIDKKKKEIIFSFKQFYKIKIVIYPCFFKEKKTNIFK